MNIYLLQLVGKWFSLILVTFISFFNTSVLKSEEVDVINANQNRNLSVINTVVPYEQITKYNSKLPYQEKKVITPGVEGVVYTDSMTNKAQVLQQMVPEVVEVGSGPRGKFVGRMTGYGPDCPGCSSVGNVACHTKNGGKHSLIYDGINYKDDEYGDVRILAASRSVFPCGTIIEVSRGDIKFLGVVLDGGGSMESAYKNSGTIWIDLAYASQADARQGFISGTNIQYNVKRWGF